MEINCLWGLIQKRVTRLPVKERGRKTGLTGHAPADLAKYGADGPFASFVQSRLGYAGDLQSADDLMAHILLSSLSCTLPGWMPKGLSASFASRRASPVRGFNRQTSRQVSPAVRFSVRSGE